jgi:CheY-like chemotaxis protein
MKGSNHNNLQILVVEDNELNQDIAKAVLEKDGHSVSIAPNGRQALEILGKTNFDVIFMDVQMPEMDGLTATTIIRHCEAGQASRKDGIAKIEEEIVKRHSGKHIPIIAMTANAMGGDKKKCLDAGMDDYLTKPFIQENVYSVLNKLSHVSQS